MSDFSCPVVRISKVSPIHDADRIELARVFALDVIVNAGQFKLGDLAIYLPPDAVLPAALAVSLKGRAKLFGERRNRVRPFRLRGALSEGVLLGPLPQGAVGQDAAAALGVTRYVEPAPLAWRGECVAVPGLTIPYDIRSGRRHPGVFRVGEPVEITEKLHGTMCAVGYFPKLRLDGVPHGDTLVYSKGLGQTGHALKEGNERNLYFRASAGLRERLKAAFNDRSVTAFGEIYGATVQDLDYGRTEPALALFDIYLGVPGAGHWLDRREFNHVVREIAPTAPILYLGPLLATCEDGLTFAGNGVHLREGSVIRPAREKFDHLGERVIAKYVAAEYLARRGGTEFT